MPDYDKMSVEELQALVRNAAAQRGQDIDVVPKEHQDLTGLVGATPKDVGRGVYHGGLDLAATPGVVGDVAQGINGTFGTHIPSSITNFDTPRVRNAVEDYVTNLLGTSIDQPHSGLGALARLGTTTGAALALPGPKGFGARLASNVAAPMIGSEVAGAVTGDNELARTAGAMLAGRSVAPFGKATLNSASKDITGKALNEIGIPDKNTFLDKAGNKTVIPDRIKELGGLYQNIEDNARATGGPRVAQLLDETPKELRNQLLGQYITDPNQKAFWNELNRQNRIGNDLDRAAGSITTGRFTPKDVREITDVDKGRKSELHGLASKLEEETNPKGPGMTARVLGAGLGYGAGHLAGSLIGHPEFGPIAMYGSAALGAGMGPYLARKIAPELVNRDLAQALMGKGGIPRIAGGSVLYSAQQRAKSDED